MDDYDKAKRQADDKLPRSVNLADLLSSEDIKKLKEAGYQVPGY